MLQGMARGGKNELESEAFFSKIITAEKGVTFDQQGNPLLYRRPKFKDEERNMEYSVQEAIKVDASRKQKHKKTGSGLSDLFEQQDSRKSKDLVTLTGTGTIETRTDQEHGLFGSEMAIHRAEMID